MSKLLEILSGFGNFNLIKYTGHYALTIDRGMGKPLIIQGDNLEEIEAEPLSLCKSVRHNKED
jgi:hypothetical protein